MKRQRRRETTTVRSSPILATTAAIVIAIACSLAAVASGAAAPTAATVAAKGKVTAIFAGSLVNVMEKAIGPEFTAATGYPFEGFGGGSNEDANAIKGEVRQGDGNWVSWYSTFTSSDLVLGYDPRTKLGKQLAAGKPWYKVITEPGIIVGRTDPKADPKGRLTVEALDAAARKLHDSALTRALSKFPIFEETSMLARLQAGQLDAGFFYVVEAKTAHVPTVPLTPIYKYADYTLTLLNNAENQSGAEALVAFLLSPKRKAVEKRYGLVPTKPTFSGAASAVPGSLRRIVGAR
jgi:molybdate/tungstate transport system substrate-binding protein